MSTKSRHVDWTEVDDDVDVQPFERFHNSGKRGQAQREKTNKPQRTDKRSAAYEELNDEPSAPRKMRY